MQQRYGARWEIVLRRQASGELLNKAGRGLYRITLLLKTNILDLCTGMMSLENDPGVNANLRSVDSINATILPYLILIGIFVRYDRKN
jgi:hypothetical protein